MKIARCRPVGRIHRLMSMTRAAWKAYLCLALICLLVALPGQADPLLKSIAPGSWGGEHIRMIVTAVGATVGYDCARGTIDEPLLVERNGNFEALGNHVFERGGPARPGEPQPVKHSALYRGWTDGNQMRLTVSLIDTEKEVGTFWLGLGRTPMIEKCL